MKTGLWPDRDEECTTEQYLGEYGGRHDKRWEFIPRPMARCPACFESMKLVGEDRPPHDRHFSHIGSSEDAPPCPLRNLADHKYEFLTEAPLDSERGRILRASFFQHWKYHWKQLCHHLDGISDIFHFIDMIKVADRTRLWHRPSLEEWEIPYIFLVWRDYPPVRNKKTKKYIRREWYRFWFDGRVRTLDDIWIRTQGKPRIVRATYAIPHGGKAPGLDQLRDTSLIELDEKFLSNNSITKLHEYVIRMMHQNFPTELEFVTDEP